MPIVAAARCTMLIAVPTLTSSPSQNGCSALYPAASIMPIMLGVEYTGGSSGFHADKVFLNSTVVSASPRVPRGISFAILRDYREGQKNQRQPPVTRMMLGQRAKAKSTTEGTEKNFGPKS